MENLVSYEAAKEIVVYFAFFAIIVFDAAMLGYFVSSIALWSAERIIRLAKGIRAHFKKADDAAETKEEPTDE